MNTDNVGRGIVKPATYLGYFHWTEEQAKEQSIARSKHFGQYCTYIKGKPDSPLSPDECYAVTNDMKHTPKMLSTPKKTNRRKKCNP